MKQRATVLLALLVAIGILTGCSDRGEAYGKLTAAEVGERIGQSADLSDMRQEDEAKLRKLYRIEASDVADFVLYTALSNVRADELAVIKVKDARDTDGIMARMRQRIEAQTVKFQSYRPAEYALIGKHVLKAKRPFVLFAVSKDAERMEDAFDDALKEAGRR